MPHYGAPDAVCSETLFRLPHQSATGQEKLALAALRVVPVLQHALREEAEERLRAVVLPSFRALAAANFAGTWPTRASEIRSAARAAGRDAGDAVHDIGHAAQMNIIEAQDAIPEMYETVWRLEGDARAIGIAEPAVDAAIHAVQASVDAVDATKRIASPDAVFESCVAAATAACSAVEGAHGDTGFLAGEKGEGEAPVAAHIVEFWQAVWSDAAFLESGAEGGRGPQELVARLSRSALWREGIPVWAGRRWADLKDDLPESEEWSNWAVWYEGRLTGHAIDAATEFERVTGSKAEWVQGPGHEAEDPETWYYADDESGSYVTAPQLKALPESEQIAYMVSWFRRMYEDPINEMPYDGEVKDYLYIWGGPFNASDEFWDEFGGLVSDEIIQAAASQVERDGTVDWAPSDSNPKHMGALDVDEDDDEELVPPTLDDIRERLERGNRPTFGAPLEAQGRREVRSEIARLRAELARELPKHGAIGHNRPPESLSLTDELTAEVTQAADEIETEVSKPAPNVETVVQSTSRLERVVLWMGRKLDIAVDAFMARIGAAVGVATIGGGLALSPIGESVVQVFNAVLRWLDVVTLPF